VPAHAVATNETADAASWQFGLRSDHHSDAVELRDLDGDALRSLAPRPGRNLAYVDDELRASRRLGDWTWSLLARSRATLVVNADALALVAHVEAEPAARGSAHWATEARWRGFTGAGLEVERRFVLGDAWQARVGVQGLLLRHWRERRIDGTVDYDAATAAYAFDLRSTQTDDRLSFPFRRGFAARGAALLFSGELAWQGDRWHATLGASDVGWLRWRGVPQEQAQLSTTTRAYDADGFVIYRPLIQGVDSQGGRTRAAPARASASLAWQATRDAQLIGAADWIAGFGALPRVAWQQRWGALELGAAWRTHERRLTLSAAWQGLRLQLGADRAGGSARSREFALLYAFRLP
jgi:hypothetical protein